MDFSMETLHERELIPGFRGKFVHGEALSLAFWEVDPGATVPEHKHEHEQIMHVVEGQFEFTLDGLTRVYGPGDIVLIPPYATHSGRALGECRLMDIFSPVREEYR
ncbi:MAG: cupin domain-containing protein [Bacteroidetes bacterium]|nr:MAG: cupin domain-containing protein [Bacteroidota bacterium]